MKGNFQKSIMLSMKYNTLTSKDILSQKNAILFKELTLSFYSLAYFCRAF